AETAALGADRLLVGTLGNLTLNVGGLDALSEWVRRGRMGTWSTQARAAARRSDTNWRGVLFMSFGPWIPAPVAKRLNHFFRGIRTLDEASFLRAEWTALARSRSPAPELGMDSATQ